MVKRIVVMKFLHGSRCHPGGRHGTIDDAIPPNSTRESVKDAVAEPQIKPICVAIDVAREAMADAKNEAHDHS
jgi:hypothetical protein